MNRTKVALIASMIACIVLAGTLVKVMLDYQALMQQREEEYREQLELLMSAVKMAKDYWEDTQLNLNGSYAFDQELRIGAQNYFLGQHADLYEAILNGVDPKTLKTIIMHASEKTWSEPGHIPDVAYTYKKLVRGFAPHEVLILPEYQGNLNWTETLHWIESNFTGVKICLSIFEGGNESLPNPNVKLGINEIKQAMTVADVKMVRLAEIASWYIDRNETKTTPFPTEDVREILAFCKENNLRVLWSEWKISPNAFAIVNSTIAGYEDTVTVAYQTNDEFDEPFFGFLYATQFQHWGASIQSWYWVYHKNETQDKMPVYLMAEHTKLARNMGAEIIQFEPYVYFFDDNGEPLESMKALWSTI